MSFTFDPSTLTVRRGDTVRATNQDSTAHTFTGSTWDSGDLSKGESYSWRFTTAGSFDFVCTRHPSMKGTVTVTS